MQIEATGQTAVSQIGNTSAIAGSQRSREVVVPAPTLAAPDALMTKTVPPAIPPKLDLLATDRSTFTVTSPVELQPGKQLPVSQPVMKSMNNVDVVKQDDRFYMAYRTAPSHFASDKTLMNVVSSADGQTWQAEQTIQMGADVREPRFLSLNGKLFLYWFKGGTNPFAFEPQRMYLSEKTATGWSKPRPFGPAGWVPWRVKEHGGKAYLSAYNGTGLYGDQKNSEIRLFESTDGRNWAPISQKPQSTSKGGEEPEFEFDREGNLWGTIRLEKDGAEIVYAPKDDLSDWQTVKTPNKYDSALLFRHGDELYLVARRNVDGTMDKAPKWLPEGIARWYNMARYSLTTKRTTIYHLDRQTKTIQPITDLPSHGDTAFPAIAKLNDRQYLLMNYSSKLEKGKDYPWIVGQLNPTRLYQQTITFDRPDPAPPSVPAPNPAP